MRSHLAAALAFVFLACSSPESDGFPAATPQRIESVCDDWSQVLCGQRDACGDDDLEVCLTSAKSQCVYDANVEEAGCQAARLAAVEDCAARLGGMTCDEWCTGGTCALACPYECGER